jgi:hypothetical protein
MTFKGLLKRLLFTGLLLFLIHGFNGELGWSLYLAAMPVIFYEMLRPR